MAEIFFRYAKMLSAMIFDTIVINSSIKQW